MAGGPAGDSRGPARQRRIWGVAFWRRHQPPLSCEQGSGRSKTRRRIGSVGYLLCEEQLVLVGFQSFRQLADEGIGRILVEGKTTVPDYAQIRVLSRSERRSPNSRR